MSKRTGDYGSFDGYRPIRTKADRRAEALAGFAEGLKDMVGIEGSLTDHLKHRLSLKTIGKEVYAHFTDKVLPHGANEVGNVLYGGSGYIPWPGSNGPAPIPASETEPEYRSIHEAGSPMVTPTDGPSDPYLSGRGYSPEPDAGGPSGMYLSQLDQAARRGRDDEPGRTR